MQIYTITREEIEQYKRDNDNHGLPDNLDLLVAAVLYDREVGEPEFAATASAGSMPKCATPKTMS